MPKYFQELWLYGLFCKYLTECFGVGAARKISVWLDIMDDKPHILISLTSDLYKIYVTALTHNV